MNTRYMLAAAALFIVAAIAAALDPAVGLPAALSLAVIFPVASRSFQELDEASQPAAAGVSEAIPHMIYDTETFVDNAAQTLNFFSTTKSDPSLSNMELAGTFPQPQFFEMWYVGLDILIVPSATALIQWSDMWQLLFGTGVAASNRAPTWQLNRAGKIYGPYPLSTLHGTGGLHGSNGYGTTTANTVNEYATNSVPDGGYYMGGAVILRPSTNFGIQCRWPVAINTAANLQIRINSLGVLHRSVS